jgi:hypothetical protein
MGLSRLLAYTSRACIYVLDLDAVAWSRHSHQGVQVLVAVPKGAMPGGKLSFEVASGRKGTITLPEGAVEGTAKALT